MALDPSIILGYRPPQIESPLNAIGNALKIKGMQQDSELGAMKADEYKRGVADDRALADAYKGSVNPDGSINRNNLYSNLATRGLGAKLPVIQKGFADQDKSKADTEKAQIEAHLKKFEVAGQIMAGVSDQATWDQARATTAQVFGPEAAAQMPAQYDPAEVERKRQQALTVKDQLEQKWKAMEYTTPKADAVLQSTTSTANNERTNATTRRGQNMVDERAREVNSALTGTDAQQQIDYWANVIAKGGTLPPGLARGKDGSAFVREVTKRVATLGTSGEDLMANQAEFGGAKAGQRTLGTKQANIEMAATEAYNMMPIALAASAKVDRTSYPSLNNIIQAAQKGTGDENVVQLSVAVNSLVNSYSRAISPTGVPTISDKDHAREILDKAYSKGQFAAAVDLMKQEIETARKSPVQVREHMRPGGGKSDASTAPAPKADMSAIDAELARRGVK